MKFYFAAPFGYSPQLLPLKILVEDAGHKVTSSWLQIPSFHRSKSPMEAVNFALQDLADVDACDMLILFNPPDEKQTPGRNIEFGYALAKGKMLGICGKQWGVFQQLPSIYTWRNSDSLLEWLKAMTELEYTG